MNRAVGLLGELLRFGFVGGLATLTHFIVASALFSWTPVGIFAANLAGFVIAVAVSFFGHRNLTFRATEAGRAAAVRFFGVAVAGFLVNTGVLAVATYAVGRETLWSLALAVFVAAGFVYLASKLWAFRA